MKYLLILLLMSPSVFSNTNTIDQTQIQQEYYQQQLELQRQQLELQQKQLEQDRIQNELYLQQQFHRDMMNRVYDYDRRYY